VRRASPSLKMAVKTIVSQKMQRIGKNMLRPVSCAYANLEQCSRGY